jgi:Rieske Fe-S protein
MQMRAELSRKSFIKLLGGVGTALLALIWYRLSDFRYRDGDQLVFRFDDNVPMGVSYFGKYYLFRDEVTVRAFSTTCTHAGCRLGKGNAQVLRCGCHGSRFDAATGKPMKGPAFLPLLELECHFESKSRQWVVKFHS